MAANVNPASEAPEKGRGNRADARPVPGRQRRPGEPIHSAYTLDRLLRGDGVDGRTRLARWARDARLAFALASGYPAWHSVPRPLQAAIRNCVRLEAYVAALFSPFWRGQEPPARFLGAAEMLRRQLRDVGLEPRAQAGPDVAAMLAAMRIAEERRP